tara:strand:+ start:218 stop:1120 length:903 start_codon:yes stop_codon:yes gene_type:complete
MMEFLSCFRQMTILTLSLGMIQTGLFADSHLKAAEGEGTGSNMQRWEPRYRIRKRSNLTQRERRTGVMLEAREGSYSVYKTKQTKEWIPREPKVKGEKRGFWSYLFAKEKRNQKMREQAKEAEAQSATKDAQETKPAVESGQEAPSERKGFISHNKKKRKKFGRLTKWLTGGESGSGQSTEGEPSAAAAAADSKESAPKSKKKTIDADYQKGKQHFDNGNYQKAISYFQQFLNTNTIPNNPLEAPANYFIGKSFENLDPPQPDVAIHQYRKITENYKNRQFWAGLAALEISALEGTGKEE